MKLSTKIFVLISLFISCLVITGAGFYVKHAFLFKAKIIDDIYIVQRPFQDVYDLVSKKADFCIEDAGGSNGWMIEGDYLYGSAESEPNYYVVDLSTHELIRFESLSEFNSYLRGQNLSDLNMSRQESTVHLKYGRGRNRIYSK